VVTRDYVSSHAEKKFDFDFERNQSWLSRKWEVSQNAVIVCS
jgi:hypothetical protein